MGFEAIGQISAVCGCITAVGAVVALIIALIKRAKAPNEAQDHRLDEIEKRLDQHDQCLKNDLERLDKFEAGNRIMQRGMLALLAHGIDGNDIESMKKVKDDLHKFLIEH